MEEVKKPVWQSKVAILNVLMGLIMILAVFSPEAAAFLQNNIAPHLAEAGAAWAVINVILRVFKSNIVF
jgi:hypothetical protein